MPIAAIVLAAGLSSRMGRNKLLEKIGDRPLVRRVAGNALASCARPVIVVVGHEAGRVMAALSGLDVQTIANPKFRDGLAASIRAGVAAVPESCAGALILPGDMPRISKDLIDRVIAGFAPAEGRAICVAIHCGLRGHPVLFGRQFFRELLALAGDIGARQIIAENETMVCEIEADDDGPLADIDTPGALAKFRASIP